MEHKKKTQFKLSRRIKKHNSKAMKNSKRVPLSYLFDLFLE